MARKQFHINSFDEGTRAKLEIFKEYFKESFPVFIFSPYFKEILIYDFFAGQGKDVTGEFGTALNILDEITSHCKAIRNSKKEVFVILNDKKEAEKLSENVGKYLKECRIKCKEECVLQEEKNLIIRNKEFSAYFNDLYPILVNRKRSAKLIFLDPYNFVIDKKLFKDLIDLPNTDFICFMPTSFLLRFPEEPAFKKYINTNEIDFKTSKPAHCHRVIADYFNSLVPTDKEYYTGCFSIKKGSNYYGLLFGSSHTLGAEKFQKVCWKQDSTTGEANYNIDRELVYNQDQGILFQEAKIPQKIKSFEKDLTEKILNKEIITNTEAYKFALKRRCLVKYASEVLNSLMNEKKIHKFRTRNNDVHKIKQPIKITLK